MILIGPSRASRRPWRGPLLAFNRKHEIMQAKAAFDPKPTFASFPLPQPPRCRAGTKVLIGQSTHHPVLDHHLPAFEHSRPECLSAAVAKQWASGELREAVTDGPVLLGGLQNVHEHILRPNAR